MMRAQVVVALVATLAVAAGGAIRGGAAANEPKVARTPDVAAVTSEEFLELVLGNLVRGRTIPDGRHFTWRLHEDGRYEYRIEASELYDEVFDSGEWWENPGGYCVRSTAGRYDGCRRIMKARGDIYHVVNEDGRLIATWTIAPPAVPAQ